MVVDRTAGILTRAQPVMRGYFDWQSAGYALPAQLIQLEGLHFVSPDNEQLTLTLARAHTLYATGWVNDDLELARQAGAYDQVDQHRLRAHYMFLRARDVALRVVKQRRPELHRLLLGSPEQVAAYLESSCDEADLPALYWLLIAWGSAIDTSVHPEDNADLGALRDIAHWIELRDPGYEGAGALLFLGTIESKLPRASGGRPERAKAHFQRALELSGRHNQLVHVNYATHYAAAVQDRTLYLALLREVIESGD
ncbi:MAG: hypothetical protein RL701_5971, partial [Pseudomonadota bacterium]